MAFQTINIVLKLQDRISTPLKTATRQVDALSNSFAQLDNILTKNNKMQSANILRQRFNTNQRLRRQDLNNERQYQRNLMLENQRSANRIAEIKARAELSNTRRKSNFSISDVASGIYVVKNIIDAASSVITSFTDRADTIASQKAILGMYNTTGYSTNQVYDYLTATALRTRSNLGATADLTNALLAAGVYQGPNAAINTIDTVGLINKSLIAGGTRGQQADSVLLQLSQGLAQGQLQGQELRAIRQYAPYMGNIIAEGLNMQGIFDKEVTFGDLKDLGAEGELTADRLLKAFELMSDKINADFETMPKTWGQAMTSLSTIWDSFIGKLNEGDTGLTKLNETMNGFVDYLMSADSSEFWEGMATGINTLLNVLNIGLNVVISGITWLGENLDSVMNGALILLSIFTVAWAVLNWKIIAVIAVVALLFKIFDAFGIDAIDIITGIILFVYDLIKSSESLGITIRTFLVSSFYTLQSAATGVLARIYENLYDIAVLIDKITGSNIAEGVAEKVDKYKDLSTEYDIKARVERRFGESEQQRIKNEQNAFHTNMDNLVNSIKNSGNIGDNLGGLFGTGGLGSSIYSGGNFGTGGIADTYVTGGSLDSGGEVQLSNEDIKLLRDIAARDFLLNVSTITPTVTNNFGDIRETADVNKILDEIERMVDEELATSVVMG